MENAERQNHETGKSLCNDHETRGPKEHSRQAAVLVPVYRSKNGALEMVIVRRSGGGIHGGQLAFPGGMRECEDDELVETALREAREETGIVPETVNILASLPPVDVSVTGVRIYPFLAGIVPPDRWRRDEREIDEILEVRLLDLTRPGVHGERVEQFPGYPPEPWRISFYRIGQYRLWGASYRILHPLLPRLLADEWIV